MRVTGSGSTPSVGERLLQPLDRNSRARAVAGHEAGGDREAVGTFEVRLSEQHPLGGSARF